MKIGDIILIPFSFSEFTHTKVRPAVVIAETADNYKDLVVSAISSVASQKLNSREILVKSNRVNMLRVDSIIKVDRIVTLKKEDKIADLGQLSKSELSAFQTILIEMVK